MPTLSKLLGILFVSGVVLSVHGTGRAEGATAQPAPPVQAQAPAQVALAAPDIRAGLKEMSVSAIVIIPNSSVIDALGLITGRLGYYVSARNAVGVGATFFVYSRVTDLYLTAYYRRLFRAADARLQPFMAASVGSNVLTYYGWGGTYTRLLAMGEAGARYFLSPATAIDAALSLSYIRGEGEGFSHTTSTVFTVGLAHVF